MHTDAIKQNLVPAALTSSQINRIYAFEADVLNMALFGITAKEWRDVNPDKKGNIRDYADISQLVCLSNLENLNAHFIGDNVSQPDRLGKLNAIAIHQMKLLTEDICIRGLETGSGDYTRERKKSFEKKTVNQIGKEISRGEIILIFF